MKLLVILCSAGTDEAVLEVIGQHHVHGFTQIPELRGSGNTGRHLGTRAWPGTVTLVLTAVPDDTAADLVAALAELAATCSPGEGIRVFRLDVDEVVGQPAVTPR